MKSAMFAVGACLFVVFANPLAAFADEATGVMMVVKGDIKVTAGKDGKTESARVGRKVFSGDTIIAGSESRAKIVMTDKNILNISPDSKMTIEKYLQAAAADGTGGQVELKVEYGKVRATVEQKYDGEKSKFNIKTPTAVAGVRGTDFITGFNRQNRQSTIITFSGTVAVGTMGANGAIQNAVFVRPGQQTNVGAGKMPDKPVEVPKVELNNMNRDSSADQARNAPAPAANNRAPAASGNSMMVSSDVKPDVAIVREPASVGGNDKCASCMVQRTIPTPPPTPPPQPDALKAAGKAKVNVIINPN